MERQRRKERKRSGRKRWKMKREGGEREGETFLSATVWETEGGRGGE